MVYIPSDSDKKSFEKQLAEHFKDAQIETTPEQRKIDRLEKQKAELEQGIDRKYVSKGFKPTEQQKEKISQLEDDIADLKDRLGVIRSNMDKPGEDIENSEHNLLKLQEKFASKNGNKFTVDEGKDIWDYAKKEYLNKGVSYSDMIGNVADDLGLTVEQIHNAIVTPKIKPISIEMWKEHNKRNRGKAATKAYIDERGKSALHKAFDKSVNIFREGAVFGHGGIFVGTHALPTLADPVRAKYTLKAMLNAYKLAYGNSATYELMMQDLKHSKNYDLAQRAGLQNNPDHIGTDEELTSSILKRISDSGKKGFNAIKILRQNLFDSHYDALSEADKQDPESVKAIAQIVNNATGATNVKLSGKLGDSFKNITFAGGMELSRWERMVSNPVKSGNIAFKALFQPEKATPSEKIFAKLWAKRAGTIAGVYFSGLAINNALLSPLGYKQRVNFTDPSKSDFLRMKFGNKVVDASSGMISSINFLSEMANIATENERSVKKENAGDNRLNAIAHRGFKYGLGKLSPAYSTIGENVLKHDYSGNTIPYSSDKPYSRKYNHKLTWPEYIWEKAPLPVAEAAHIYYEEAHKQGMGDNTWHNLLKAASYGAASGLTGIRIYEKDDNNKK